MVRKQSKTYYNMAMTESRVLKFDPSKAIISVQFEDKDEQRARSARKIKWYHRKARHFSPLQVKTNPHKSSLWNGSDKSE